MKCKYCGSENTSTIIDYFGSEPYKRQLKCNGCGCKYEIPTTETLVGLSGDFIQNKDDYEFVSIPKIKKLLIVEDGSIDLENCEQDLLDAGIKCIVYRQGSQPPRLYDLGE